MFFLWVVLWLVLSNLKDVPSQKRKLTKIMKPIHDDGEFLSVNDVPWLEVLFDSHDHFSTWLYWVRRVYPKKKLIKLEQILDAATHSQVDKFDMVRPLNLHFNHFADPRSWSDLPKRSVIFIDECQQFFLPGLLFQKASSYCRFRDAPTRRLCDIHFVTQDRTLCDANLRKLVGCHVHFFNPLGS